MFKEWKKAVILSYSYENWPTDETGQNLANLVKQPPFIVPLASDGTVQLHKDGDKNGGKTVIMSKISLPFSTYKVR